MILYYIEVGKMPYALKEAIIMKAKGFLSMGLSVALAYILSVSVLAEGIETQTQSKTYATGGIADEAKAIEAFVEETSAEDLALINSESYLSSSVSLPTSVDLSNSPCFPPIGNQGDLGSCSSFATTYYQYSYEVNKLNNVTSTNDRVIYSPAWTFNLVCLQTGDGVGSRITDNYKVLKNVGGLNLNDFPYVGSSIGYIQVPMGARDEKLEALKTRISSQGVYYMVTDSDKITSVNSDKISELKQILYNQKALVVLTNCKYNTKKNSNNECVVYRSSEYDNFAHALTVVGYNDNISIDVNGNGQIEDCEKGAVKVVNSWGTNTYSDAGRSGLFDSIGCGYFWVLYDAFNVQSANTVNNWESNLGGTRCLPFSGNAFFYINVDHYEPNLVGELNINTDDREGMIIKAARTSSSTTVWSDDYSKIISPFDGGNNANETKIPFNGVILFDYDTFADPISTYKSGYNWHVKIDDVSSSATGKFRIIDGEGNAITTYKTLGRSSSNALIACQNVYAIKGDVNYDKSLTTEDVEIISSYVLGSVTPSALQTYLADYDNNGVVNIYDAIAVSQLV